MADTVLLGTEDVTLTGTVGTSSTEIGTIAIRNPAGIVSFKFSVDGGNMSAFKIQQQLILGGDFDDMLEDADFTITNPAIVEITDTAPHEVTDGNYSIVKFYPGKCKAVKFYGTASASSTVTIDANWSENR